MNPPSQTKFTTKIRREDIFHARACYCLATEISYEPPPWLRLFKRRPRADNTENRGKFASLSPIRRVFNRFRNLRANFFNQRPLAEERRGKKRNPAHFSILLFSSSEHPPLIEKFSLPFRLKLSPYLETSSHDKPRGLSLRVSPLVNV